MVKTVTPGVRIKQLRTEADLSQRELERRIKKLDPQARVSYAYLSRLEGGSRNPSVRVLRQIARALGTSAHYLETGTQAACPHCGGPLDEPPR